MTQSTLTKYLSEGVLLNLQIEVVGGKRTHESLLFPMLQTVQYKTWSYHLAKVCTKVKQMQREMK